MIDPNLKEWATEVQAKHIDAYNEHGSYRKVAKALGIHKSTVQKSVKLAKKKAALAGYSPDYDMTRPAPEGFGVKGVSTYYDEDGNVTCVEYSFTNPRDIQSGQTGSFEILIPYRVDLIKDYVLLLQSEDYVSINEFPSKTIFTIFTLAVLLSYSAFHFKNREKPPEKKAK